jgi:hypothetical protein
MQLDPLDLLEPELLDTIPELHEQRPELPGPNPEVPELRLQLTGPKPDAQDQKIVPFMQQKDTQMVGEPQSQSPQCTASTTKVEGSLGSATLEADTSKEVKIPEAQKELDSTTGRARHPHKKIWS